MSNFSHPPQYLAPRLAAADHLPISICVRPFPVSALRRPQASSYSEHSLVFLLFSFVALLYSSAPLPMCLALHLSFELLQSEQQGSVR